MQTSEAAQSFPAQRFSLLLEQLTRQLRSVASAGGLSASAASALGRLQQGGAVRVTDLAHAEGVSQPSMTQLVTRMESDGLVGRQPAADDRRSILVTLTEHGHTVLEQRRARRTALLQQLVAELDADERATITAALPALERLVDASTSWRAQNETMTLKEIIS